MTRDALTRRATTTRGFIANESWDFDEGEAAIERGTAAADGADAEADGDGEDRSDRGEVEPQDGRVRISVDAWKIFGSGVEGPRNRTSETVTSVRASARH